MAETLQEARRYLVSKTREIAEEMLPTSMVLSVKFVRDLPSQNIAMTNISFWDKKSPKEHSRVTVYFNLDDVDRNKYNIENDFFIDLIKHELSHAIMRYREWGRIKRGVQETFSGEHHGSKEYRKIVKKYTGDVISSTGMVPDEHRSPLSYHGDRYGYGYVPRYIENTYLQKCLSCGTLRAVINKKTDCPKCDSSDTMIIKKMAPEEVTSYISKLADENKSETGIPFQEYLKRKYARYERSIPIKPHRARVKRQKVRKNKIHPIPNILKNLKKLYIESKPTYFIE